MKLAYICHPISGDQKGNVDRILAIIRDINLNEPYTVPFAPYLSDVMALNDNIPSERERGLKNSLWCLKFVDELRVYGEPSEGMKAEIKYARDLGINIVYI